MEIKDFVVTREKEDVKEIKDQWDVQEYKDQWVRLVHKENVVIKDQLEIVDVNV